MFPDARNSLRRWSESADTKIPIPVAITLQNFYHDDGYDKNESLAPSGIWLNHQTQHRSTLLPRLNLEITVTKKDGEEKNETSSTAVVLSQNNLQNRSVHPSWEHLDELLSRSETLNTCKNNNKGEKEYSYWWDDHVLYKSMRVKLSTVQYDKDDRNKSQQHGTADSETDTFLETFLHPSLLERIDLKSLKNSSSNERDLDKCRTNFPPALPPNSLLIHFSDGSIRCQPHIYQILWDYYGKDGLLNPNPVETFSRFEDDVFDTLDQVKQTPQRSRARSVSSLLDTDDEVQNEELSAQQQDLTAPINKAVYICSRLSNGIQKQNHKQYPVKQTIDAFSYCENDVRDENMRKEKLNLQRLIAEEELLLKEEITSLEEEKAIIIDLMKEVQIVERDILRTSKELKKQLLKWKRNELLKSAQSIKLIRDLRDIYPITTESATMQSFPFSAAVNTTKYESGGKGYIIRGLRLPVDIYTTGIPEEEVNASLGYCAHLVLTVAKYLNIHLRYRIFCNGSRSAIELESGIVLPLFLGRLAARALEREQVDRGARLLGANVDCILMHLNLMSLQEYHILARLQIILNFVAEGKLSRLV